MRATGILFTLACCLLCVPAVARAQTGTDTNTDLQDFLPFSGPADFLTIPSPVVSPHRSVGFGLVLNYVHKPLSLAPVDRTSDFHDSDALEYQATADFLWSFALWNRLQLGLALPVIVAQAGESVRPISCLHADDCPFSELASTAIRDVRLDAKLRLAREGVGSAMAFAVSASLPSGDEENFAGQEHPTVSPMFLLGGVQLGPRLDVGLALGARLRKRTEIADSTWGSELFARAGIGAKIIAPLRLTLEYFGTIPLEEGADERQELLGGIRYSPDAAGDVTLEAGFGAGMSDSPGGPQFRAVVGVRYAPLGRDGDEDGVLDRTDACQTRAEDRDGFEDADGCPEDDNDEDGVPDAQDGCDDVAEDRDGRSDDDGCPDPDDDGDGVPDAADQCAAEPEDRDGFEDADGCTEPDNDQDGVLDAGDRCPGEAEDRDTYEDDDGCPDLDNDGDQQLDGADRCRNEAEDRDGWQDEDGCPEPDDDFDGVLDPADRCVHEPETINGRTDEDGCPDAGAASVTVDGDRVVLQRPLRFAPGTATVPAATTPLVRQLGQLLRGRAGARFSLLGYGDRPVDDQVQRDVALRRAEALRDALVQEGVAAVRFDVGVGVLTERRTTPTHVDLRLLTPPAAAAPPVLALPPAPAPAPPPGPAPAPVTP